MTTLSWLRATTLPLLLAAAAPLDAQAPFSVGGRQVETKADGPCWDDTLRYVDCGNGTVTDTVTGLIWLADASCTEMPGAGGTNVVDWPTAMQAVAGLESGLCGLTDGSQPGDWRLPTAEEWQVTTAYAREILDCPGGASPVWTNDAGTACYNIAAPGAITGLFAEKYWSSSVDDVTTTGSTIADLDTGSTTLFLLKALSGWVWAVRDVQ